MPVPLSLSIASISSDPRESISLASALMSSLGEPRVHLDATFPGLRPRELDRSARRDLASILKRAGVLATGIDLFLPPAHLADASHVDRAVQAILDAVELISDLAALGSIDAGVLCLALPPRPLANAMQAIASAALERSLAIADFSLAAPPDIPASIARGVDCAQAIAAGHDPATLVARGVAAIRLCDWDGSKRVPIGKGRLDVQSTVASASVAAPAAPVVVDLRGIDRATGQSWEAWAKGAAEAWKGGLPRGV